MVHSYYSYLFVSQGPKTKASSLEVYFVIAKGYSRHRKAYPFLAQGVIGNDEEGRREEETVPSNQTQQIVK